MTDIAFTPDRLEQCQKLVKKYEKPQCALLPVLYLAQDQYKYLTLPVMAYVAKLLEMPTGKVVDAVSFYSMFKREDPGKFCFQICHNVTCRMMGAEKMMAVAKEELGVGKKVTTEDGRFSFETVECLGSCDNAPVLQLNNEFLKPINEEGFRDFLKKLKQGNEASISEVLS